MNNKTIEAFEHADVTEEEALERLIKLGRKQGYVSIDDVLQLVPGEQRQSEQLEEIIEALLTEGIPLVEDEEDIGRFDGFHGLQGQMVGVARSDTDDEDLAHPPSLPYGWYDHRTRARSQPCDLLPRGRTPLAFPYDGPA